LEEGRRRRRRRGKHRAERERRKDEEVDQRAAMMRRVRSGEVVSITLVGWERGVRMESGWRWWEVLVNLMCACVHRASSSWSCRCPARAPRAKQQLLSSALSLCRSVALTGWCCWCCWCCWGGRLDLVPLLRRATFMVWAVQQAVPRPLPVYNCRQE
jgi:hypothetical protein